MKKLFSDCLYAARRIWARMCAKHFDHVVMTGYNCELAFRFLRSRGFLDATLFCWAGTTVLEDFFSICAHIDDLMTGELLTPTKDMPLFRCAKTGLWAHGRSHANVWSGDNPPSPEFVESEAKEVRSRILYLKEKTLGYLRDEQSVLVIHKIRSKYCTKENADRTALAVKAAMEGLDARNMTLLIVCEDSVRTNFPMRHPDYELRSVAVFSPDDDALNPHLGDKRGWDIIFDEFRPKKSLKRRQGKFKFEQ